MINVQPITPESQKLFKVNCHVQGRKQRCKSRPVFMVFTGDGKPKMSRLDSRCCAKHLPYAVRAAKEAEIT